MARAISSLADLQLGFYQSAIRVRIVRVWDNIKLQTNELMNVGLVLLDEKGTCLHGYMEAHLAGKMKATLVEGSLVSIQRFRVVCASSTYKPVPGELKLQIVRITSITLLSESVTKIPSFYFNFTDIQTLKSRIGRTEIMSDIIGRLRSIRMPEDITTSNGPTRMQYLQLELEGDCIANITLWGKIISQVEELQKIDMDGTTVIAMSGVSISDYQGKLSFSSVSCTRVYINPPIPETDSIRRRFQGNEDRVEVLLPAKKQESEYERQMRNRRKIEDILAIEWSPEFKDETYTVSATIGSIADSDSKWCYIGCPSCSKKLSYVHASWFCDKCNRAISNAVHRYKVCVDVFDETARAKFIIFDKDIVRLTQQTASQLIAQQSGSFDKTPQKILNLCQQSFIFEIKVTTNNVIDGIETYTVTRVFIPTKSNDCEFEIQTSTIHPNSPTQEKQVKKRALSIVGDRNLGQPLETTSKKKAAKLMQSSASKKFSTNFDVNEDLE